MNEILHIKEPYLVAGWKYGWTRDGYRQIGVGIKMDLLEGEGHIDMKIGESKSIWRLDKEKARTFIEWYQSYHKVSEDGTLLGVVSWDKKIFEKLNKENSLFVQKEK